MHNFVIVNSWIINEVIKKNHGIYKINNKTEKYVKQRNDILLSLKCSEWKYFQMESKMRHIFR